MQCIHSLIIIIIIDVLHSLSWLHPSVIHSFDIYYYFQLLELAMLNTYTTSLYLFLCRCTLIYCCNKSKHYCMYMWPFRYQVKKSIHLQMYVLLQTVNLTASRDWNHFPSMSTVNNNKCMHQNIFTKSINAVYCVWLQTLMHKC